jgi:hypothetical protein
MVLIKMLPITKPWDNVAMALILLGWQGHRFFSSNKLHDIAIGGYAPYPGAQFCSAMTMSKRCQ